MPVHRVPGDTRGVVYAFTDELEEWLRLPQVEPIEKIESATKPGAVGRVADIELLADQCNRNRKDSNQYKIGQLDERNAAGKSGRARFASLLPSAAALVLVIAVFAGVYFYRHTARFAARAAGGRETGLSKPRHVPTPEAQEFYLKGRYYWSKRNPDDLNKAVDYFTQAIVKDPKYAAAYVGLADCYNLLREFSAMPGEEAFPRALAAAQRAVQLDDSSAEAHNSLAFATFYWNWDPPTAEREFKRGLELNPNFVQGHHWYATFLLAVQRFPEALDEIEKARKLDPSSTAILADKGYILWMSGRGKDGMALLEQVVGTDSSIASAHNYLAEMYFARKDYANAFSESKRAAQLRNDQGALAIAEAGERGFASGGLQGMYEEMLPVQERLYKEGRVQAYNLAVTCGELGRKEDALRYLQAAFDKRNIGVMFVSQNRAFTALHDDPAYREIATRVDGELPKFGSTSFSPQSEF